MKIATGFISSRHRVNVRVLNRSKARFRVRYFDGAMVQGGRSVVITIISQENMTYDP